MKIMESLAIVVFLVLLPGLASSALYKYVDDNGVTNFTDTIYKVPEKYRGRAVLVEREIQSEPAGGSAGQTLKRLTGQSEVSWQDFVVKDKDGNLMGLNPRALFMQSMLKSKLAYWLLAGLAFTVIMLVAFFYFLNWPTARGRKFYLAGIVIVWLSGSALMTVFFIRSAARDFVDLSRIYLDEVLRKAPLDEQGKKSLTELDDKLAELKSKME